MGFQLRAKSMLSVITATTRWEPHTRSPNNCAVVVTHFLTLLPTSVCSGRHKPRHHTRDTSGVSSLHRMMLQSGQTVLCKP
jgi:hypothetical protein